MNFFLLIGDAFKDYLKMRREDLFGIHALFRKSARKISGVWFLGAISIGSLTVILSTWFLIPFFMWTPICLYFLSRDHKQNHTNWEKGSGDHSLSSEKNGEVREVKSPSHRSGKN